MKEKSWSYSSWENRAKASFNFDSYKVYVIRCYSEHESFLKIGKTFTTIQKRFSEESLPYKYEIIKEYIFENGKDCSNFEKELHKKYKTLQYYPLTDFPGCYECFEENVLKDLLNETKI